jgi:hypothetical protein
VDRELLGHWGPTPSILWNHLRRKCPLDDPQVATFDEKVEYLLNELHQKYPHLIYQDGMVIDTSQERSNGGSEGEDDGLDGDRSDGEEGHRENSKGTETRTVVANNSDKDSQQKDGNQKNNKKKIERRKKNLEKDIIKTKKKKKRLLGEREGRNEEPAGFTGMRIVTTTTVPNGVREESPKIKKKKNRLKKLKKKARGDMRTSFEASSELLPNIPSSFAFSLSSTQPVEGTQTISQEERKRKRKEKKRKKEEKRRRLLSNGEGLAHG